MPEWALDILKVYGPQSIPWLALAYLGKWHLDRSDRDIQARIDMATAVKGLTTAFDKIMEKLQK